MRKTLALAVLMAAAIVTTLSPSANAITGPNAVPSERDNVVLLTFYDEEGVYLWRCSGTLIAPTIVLTAGHCTYEAAEARVWADQGPYVETPVDEGGYPLSPVEDRPPCEGYLGWPCTGEDATGEPLTYPGFGFPGIVPPEDASFPNTGDVGLVILDTPIVPEVSGFASLAEADALDVFETLRGRQNITFTAVGYGLQKTRPTGDDAVRIRLEVRTQLVNLRSSLTAGFNLQTSANPGGGRGGTCFGDSGGPIFYGASNVIVAVTSFGITPWCTGVDFAFRIDQADVLEWILEVAAAEGETVTVVPLP
jgi:Trypsin